MILYLPTVFFIYVLTTMNSLSGQIIAGAFVVASIIAVQEEVRSRAGR